MIIFAINDSGDVYYDVITSGDNALVRALNRGLHMTDGGLIKSLSFSENENEGIIKFEGSLTIAWVKGEAIESRLNNLLKDAKGGE